MKVLGIETSCDETAAAVVEDGKKILSNVVASSIDLHTAYGGVVPEIAARSHIESILPVVEKALADAFSTVASSEKQVISSAFWDQIDAIAVTQGPGLIGSLLIGVLTARTLAIAKNKPLFPVNHVQAHVYASFLTETPLPGYKLPLKQPEFPLLALIVSGGHTQLVLFKDHFDYRMLGQTTDDAAGEAYDKVAKMLGLPYPGGPSISKVAKKGNPNAFNFPKAKFDVKDVKGLTYHTNAYPFSFSGLKTAVLRAAQTASGHDYTFPSGKLPEALSKAQKADIAASFQRTVIETLVESLKKAEEEFQPKSIVIAGGVAANQELRNEVDKAFPTLPTHSRNSERSRPFDELRATLGDSRRAVIYPDIKLCTDNAAMIAVMAYFKAKHKQPPTDPYSLEADPGLKM